MTLCAIIHIIMRKERIFMLNEEKIRLMTKLALYEQKEGKKDFPLSKYYRTDYLALKMINSAIVMSLGYIILLAVIVLINVEKLLSELVNMDLPAIGRNILIAYIILFVVNMTATYFIESYRFKKSRGNLNQYNGELKELHMIYKKEENTNSFFDDSFDMENLEKADMAEFGGINDDKIIDD